MSETTRIRRSAEQWQQLIDEHAESGLSQSAFCKREHLSLSSFTNCRLMQACGAARPASPRE